MTPSNMSQGSILSVVVDVVLVRFCCLNHRIMSVAGCARCVMKTEVYSNAVLEVFEELALLVRTRSIWSVSVHFVLTLNESFDF